MKTKTEPIVVLLVDDHQVIREGIKALISNDIGINVRFECNNGNAILPILRENKVDVILMDMVMPGMNGIECTQNIVSEFPDAKIIAFTMHNQMSFIHSFIEAGAKGYVLKSSGALELTLAIHKVFEGGVFFSKDLEDLGKVVKAPKSVESKKMNHGKYQ